MLKFDKIKLKIEATLYLRISYINSDFGKPNIIFHVFMTEVTDTLSNPCNTYLRDRHGINNFAAQFLVCNQVKVVNAAN